MTNNHVLGSAQYIQVTLPDGRAYDGQIIGRDTITDLAVIKIDADNLPMLSFADTGKVRIGDPVVAIGNALGLEGTPTVTVGVLSSLDRRIRTTSGLPLQGLLQTDASINPGNSGGPLLNMAGEIVGINTALDSDIPGIGYAIGMDTILPVVDLLLTKGKVARGFLGVTLATVTPSLVRRFGLGVDEGVLIVDVLHGTPADEAGLRSLDVVTIFDGTPVITHNEFIQLIRNRTIDQELNMTYVREGQEYTISVVLIERSQ